METKTKYTPGPWRVEPHYTGGLTIAVTTQVTGSAEEAANARLIAAAPELLEAVYALEEIISTNMTHNKDCYHLTDGGSCNCGCTAAVQRAKDIASNVIAKAKGE